MRLSIVEENGWSKTVTIQNAITRVGSASSNDVCLQSERVAPLQLQIFSSPDLPSSCRVVNLADELIIYHNGAPSALPTYSTADIRDGDELEIGKFRLVFELPLASCVVRTSASMEVSISFPNAVLSADYPLEGRLTIRNTGNQKNCQFRVTLRGLPADCYQIDPIPLMYPGAQEEVRVCLFHRTTHPEAGFRDVMAVITAPNSYPGEELVIRQGIYITPVFEQGLVVLDELSVPDAPAAQQNVLAEPAKPVSAQPAAADPMSVAPVSVEGHGWAAEPVSDPAPVDIPSNEVVVTSALASATTENSIAERAASSLTAPAEPSRSDTQADIQPEPARFVETQPTRPRIVPPQDLSKLKVVRHQTDEFWDEG